MFLAGPVYVINLDLLNFLKNEYPEKKVSEICKNSTLDHFFPFCYGPYKGVFP